MMMRQDLISLLRTLWQELDDNAVQLPSGRTVPVLGEPLIGFAATDDPLFEQYKDPEVIGPDWLSPKEWLPEAKTVVGIFYPYADELREEVRGEGPVVSASADTGFPQAGKCARKITAALMEALSNAGITVLDPGRDPRFKVTNTPVRSGEDESLHFCSAWSQRHALYACGLGTFGIHRHLITEKGCAGTMGSFLIDAAYEPTPRTYTGVYDNCIMCGACVNRCPAHAITLEYYRNLLRCLQHGDEIEKLGGSECGRCMFGVPCESRNPSA